MRNYEKIKAFQLADDLVIKIYRVTQSFPKQEVYGLTSQLRRAVVSVPSNIAEGASRQYKRDYLNFLYISKGSLAESEYLLSVAHKLNYISAADHEMIQSLTQEVARTLTGLIQSVSLEVVSESDSELYSFQSRVSGLESWV